MGWRYPSRVLPPYFVIIGVVISSVGAVGYLIATLRGLVRPNRVSFFLWSVAPLIAFAAQVRQGVGLESLMTFATGFMPFLVFLATFLNRNAVWKLTAFDVSCGVLSALGLVLWQVTRVGNVAIALSILADGFAAIPTVVKAYRYPNTEAAWPWLATTVGVVLTVLTLKQFTFANAGFILYILVLDTLMYLLVRFRLGARAEKSL